MHACIPFGEFSTTYFEEVPGFRRVLEELLRLRLVPAVGDVLVEVSLLEHTAGQNGAV